MLYMLSFQLIHSLKKHVLVAAAVDKRKFKMLRLCLFFNKLNCTKFLSHLSWLTLEFFGGIDIIVLITLARVQSHKIIQITAGVLQEYIA